MSKKSEKTLPQVMDLTDLSAQDRDRTIDLLCELADIKREMGAKETKRKPGRGLMGRWEKDMESLVEILTENGIDAIRHGEIEFELSAQPGRTSLDVPKLRELLLSKGGIEMSVMNECFEAATKTGEAFTVKTLRIPGFDD